jgi:hypothetical protein
MKHWIAFIVLLSACNVGRACPLCKDSASNSEDGTSGLHDAHTSNGENISGGLNTSIYVMLGSLVGVMGLVSTVIVKGIRSSAGRRGFEVMESSRDGDLRDRK